MNNTVAVIPHETSSPHYEAVMRISEAIAACREPEELASTLADEIGDFFHFDHLYLTVFKENSSEIEYLVWGKGSLPFPDLPIEELPMWHAMASGDPQHTADWNTEERFPQFRAVGAENAARLGGARTVNDAASTTGCFRNQPRHRESIQ